MIQLMLVALGALLSGAIVYQNYIQNAETERERENDLRDKLLEKGWTGDVFSVQIEDLRIHECDNNWYKLRRLVTRAFQGETQITLITNPELAEEENERLEKLIEREYGFSVTITESEEDSRYYVILGTVDEGEVSEVIGDLQLTVDQNLVEGDWKVVS